MLTLYNCHELNVKEKVYHCSFKKIVLVYLFLNTHSVKTTGNAPGICRQLKLKEKNVQFKEILHVLVLYGTLKNSFEIVFKPM